MYVRQSPLATILGLALGLDACTLGLQLMRSYIQFIIFDDLSSN